MNFKKRNNVLRKKQIWKKNILSIVDGSKY